jgi:1-acyl-sn-glycerol-3-phosphate acyltransferase
MNHTLRFLFFASVVRPILLVICGLNVRHRERLRFDGPALVVANHNSHLDALTLICLFPLSQLPKLRPVGAKDYFFRNRWLQWFSTKILGIIPLDRDMKSGRRNLLTPISDALQAGEIVFLFPEGTRGEPEERAEFKTGIAHLAKRHAEVPVHPIFLHGLGKALPKGEALLVPFFLDVFVGEPIRWSGNKSEFMEQLTCQMTALAAEGNFPAWD